jgi:hypothetical protein
LTPEETDQLIERVATEVESRGLQIPAILFLEMHRPLAGVGSQAALAFSPFIAPFTGMDNLRSFSQLARNKEALERLICRLEASGAKAGAQG